MRRRRRSSWCGFRITSPRRPTRSSSTTTTKSSLRISRMFPRQGPPTWSFDALGQDFGSGADLWRSKQCLLVARCLVEKRLVAELPIHQELLTSLSIDRGGGQTRRVFFGELRGSSTVGCHQRIAAQPDLLQLAQHAQ